MAQKSEASGGSVTIDEITSESVKGSFVLTFSGGGNLTGNFEAPRCSVSQSNSDQPDVCEAP